MKSIIILSLIITVTVLASTVFAQAEKVVVAVYDFLTPSVSIRSYQQERASHPLEKKPESLLTPDQVDKLPEEDRLAILRREQMELQRWQANKQLIEMERYEKHMAANETVRDQLLKTEDGRAIIQASGMMEAALGRYPNVFQIKRKRGGSSGRRDITVESQVLGRDLPTGADDPSPTHYIEGQVGDLSVRELSMTDGPISVQTRLYRLPVTITLYEMASDSVVSIYSQEVTTRDQVSGMSPKSRGDIMQELLRSATQAAAANMYEAVKPAPIPGATVAGPSRIDRLREIKLALDEGLISQEEHDIERQKIMSSP